MEICLVENLIGIQPGWFALDVGDWQPDPPEFAQLQLLRDPQREAWMEFSLHTSPCAPREILFIAPSVFFRAVLRFPGDPEPARRPPSISRISIGRLLLLAARRAPLQSIAAAWWRLMGKKVRARHRIQKALAPLPCFDFSDWLEAHTFGWERELPPIQSRLHEAGHTPRFRILIGLADQRDISETTLQSIHRQLYDNWEIVPLQPHSIVSQYIIGCDWLIYLANGDSLTSDALLRIADVTDGPRHSLVYWDDVVSDESGRIPSPRLKPDWNLDLFLSTDYIGAAALRCAQLQSLEITREDQVSTTWDSLVLRIADAEGASAVAHIPRILSHRNRTGSDVVAPAEVRRRCVETHIRSKTPAAEVVLDTKGHVRISWPLPDPTPLVSLIVPTRDRVDLLRPCVDGLLHRTDYPNIEILIADNGSRTSQTHAYFDALRRDNRVRILSCPGSFNFSSINNRAAREATGRIIAFVNNDTEVIEPGWLRDMAGHALRTDAGAVGAKLLYPNGLVQHAGVVVGLGGLAGHPHRFYPRTHPGYMQRLECTQRFAAVTAACLVIERAKFLDVGGFDENAFPVAYNDVDLCLRLRERGLETVWTPYAVLNHKESASRSRDASKSRRKAYARESEIFRKRWQHVIAHDPYYNPNLTRAGESFLPAPLAAPET